MIDNCPGKRIALYRPASARAATILFYILVVFFTGLPAWLPAQSVYSCPPNIGFESGTFANWQTNTGTVSLSGTSNFINLPAASWISNSNTPGRQELMDRRSALPATDRYGGFPVNPPTGGRYALRLGSDADMGVCGRNRDSCPNALSESVRYVINVPTTATNAAITFSYAVVLENPLDALNRHSDEEQPRFRVKMYDPVTGEVIPCADFGFMASGPLPGFDTANIRKHNDAVVKYKPWSSVYVNLSRYPGRTFYLEFTTADCTKGGHFGYAYVDVTECGVSAKSLYRCASPNATTLAGPPGFEHYQWYNADFSRLIDTAQNVYITPSPPLGTQYWVIAIPYANTGCPTCDCRDTVGVTIGVTYPYVSAGEDQTACPGKPLTIGSDPIPGNTYLWTPSGSIANPRAALTTVVTGAASTYILTATDTLGCTSRDTVRIELYPPLALKAGSAVICANEFTTLHATGAASYSWSPAATLSNAASPNPVARPTVTTTYTVVGSDSVDCYTDSTTATVVVNPRPGISLGPDLTLQSGDFHTLNSTVTNGPVTAWLWNPSTNLSCNTCPEPVAEIKWDITYRAVVTNSWGCTSSDTLVIKTRCDNSTVFIPNAFTPNGDGVNDVFMVQAKNIYVVKSLKVYNRWGVVVFEKTNFSPNNPALGWDGRIGGVAAPPGVFVYTAEVQCGNGTVSFMKGNVTLLK